MNIKHTPGPWVAKDENGNYNAAHNWEVDNSEFACVTALPIAADGEVIAFAMHGDVDYRRSIDAETEANARLISAAPDLLEALMELTQLTEALLFNTMGEPGPGSIGHKCRAAIAKATGEPL